jgi:thioredoxin 1
MKSFNCLVVGLGFSFAALAASLPYDDAADAHVALQRGLSDAQNQNKDVLVIFGANWCEDCRVLDKAMRGSSASLIDSRFVVVKINVGNFNKNLDLAKRYGNPIQRGIPAAVVITPIDQVLYSTKAGELANARRMGESGIYDFFSKVVMTHQAP